MALRLRVRELAEARGYSLATFQRAVRLPPTTCRRIWFNTAKGGPAGEPLKTVWFDLLEHLADFFEVDVCDLLERIPKE